MPDFSHLKQLDVTSESTARFSMPLIHTGDEDEVPYLIVVPATTSNVPYVNAVLKQSPKHGRALRSGRVNAATLKETEGEDRALYPKHIIRGWGNIREADGSECDFSVSACEEFVRALPDWQFQELRVFCQEPLNFIEDAPTQDEIEELEGN